MVEKQKKETTPKLVNESKEIAPKKIIKPKKEVIPTSVDKTKVVVPKVELPNDVFGVKPNTQAIFDVILSERASRRQGTHSVKNRSEVSGGGKKPWKQKGTGRARAGTSRGPIWVGGGRAFGPTTARNYNLRVNKKVRKLALASALTLLAKKDGIVIADMDMEKPSTKKLLAKVAKLQLAKTLKKILIITNNENTFKSAANLSNVSTTKINSLSVEAISHTDVILLTKEHINRLVEVIK